jgi:hypothetical protein
MVTIQYRGKWTKTKRFLKNIQLYDPMVVLNQSGQKGVQALAAATPVDTGTTAASWRYTIEETSDGYTITWHNDNVETGINIAIILQYGHGTGNGGYVVGRDYINPALQTVFTDMANFLWEELRR